MHPQLSLIPVYWLIALLLLITGIRSLRAQGAMASVFWLTLALLVAAADVLPDAWLGGFVLALGVFAAFTKPYQLPAAERVQLEDAAAESGLRYGKSLLWIAVLLPVLTVCLTLLMRQMHARALLRFELNHAPLYALCAACLLLLLVIWQRTKLAPSESVRAGASMAQQIGWAMLLPMLLVVLGAVFIKAGVGQVLANWLPSILDVDNRYACVALYGLGMALLTVMLGNAFVAFPVMTAAVAVPLVIARHGGDPVVTAAIGMLSGYCGTLMSPLAANFNLIPVALMNLDSPHAVIRAQIATALPLLACNIGLLCLLVYR
jgi:uncharacterized membrane protein